MATTTAASGLTVTQWNSDFFRDYVRSNRFAKYMGTDEAAMIQVQKDLTKKKGDKITFNLVNELIASGVTGDNRLHGNEEKLISRSHLLTVNQIRNGVEVGVMEEQRSAIGLREAARVQLKEWAMKKLRDDIITALGSIDGVAYSSATASQRNTWNANNSDRVLYGKLKSNYNATHSTALANIDTTDDKMTANMVTLAKRIAMTASPKIRPITVNGDEEWFILFCDSLAFRDLKADSAIQNANYYARDRGKDNPLFTGADLMYDGVIIREIPEIASLGAVGNSSSTVSPAYLVGAQALGIGWALTTETKTQEWDYENFAGVAIREIRGVEKLRYGTDPSADTTTPKDHGVVTMFVSATADA